MVPRLSWTTAHFGLCGGFLRRPFGGSLARRKGISGDSIAHRTSRHRRTRPLHCRGHRAEHCLDRRRRRPDTGSRTQAQQAPVSTKKITVPTKLEGIDRSARGAQTVFVQLSGTGSADLAPPTDAAHQRTSADKAKVKARRTAVRQQGNEILSTARSEDSGAAKLFTITNTVPGVALRTDQDGLEAVAERDDVVKVSRDRAPSTSTNASTARTDQGLRHLEVQRQPRQGRPGRRHRHRHRLHPRRLRRRRHRGGVRRRQGRLGLPDLARRPSRRWARPRSPVATTSSATPTTPTRPWTTAAPTRTTSRPAPGQQPARLQRPRHPRRRARPPGTA